MIRRPPRSPLFPSPTLFRSAKRRSPPAARERAGRLLPTSSCAEGFLELGPETGCAAGWVALVLGELAEEPFLFVRQPFRSPDVHLDHEVAVAALSQRRQALSFESEHGAGLGAGRDSDPLLAVRRGHLELSAERGLRERQC